MHLETPCRLCGATRLHIAFTLTNTPRNIQRLLRERELDSDLPGSVVVCHCDECGLVQLTEQLESDYYDDYLMTTAHSPQMQEYQRSQAQAFVARFSLLSKRVIEIGCGDGNYLRYLAEEGVEATGLEPSAKSRHLAVVGGLRVQDGYLGRDHPADGSPYDGFVSRQVLEHVADINGFLQGICQSVAPGAAGLIEVPSLEQAVRLGRFYDFFPDHLNYFSALTLRHALARNGFDVVDVSPGMNGEYNVALMTKAPIPDLASIDRTRESTSRSVACFLSSQRTDGKRVAVWGAGGKGNTFLAVSRTCEVEYVIDSDPVKQGLYTPVSHLPIVPPKTLIDRPVDVVILTALAYRNEILHQLRAELGFRGRIVILGENLR